MNPYTVREENGWWLVINAKGYTLARVASEAQARGIAEELWRAMRDVAA